MDKSLRQRFQEIRDSLGIPINKIAEIAGIDLTKMYNFSGGSSLKDDDAIKLHKFLSEKGY